MEYYGHSIIYDRVVTCTCLDCGRQVSGYLAVRQLLDGRGAGFELEVITVPNFEKPPHPDQEMHVMGRVALEELPPIILPTGDPN